MRRAVISLLPIFLLTGVACGGKIESESSEENADASSSADVSAPPMNAYDASIDTTDASPDASGATSASCPSTIAAFCAQPGVTCSETWAAASTSNPSCDEGAYDIVFRSGSCGGYDLAETLLWDDVQTTFVYDDATGALVGITATMGTETQGTQLLCSLGVPIPSVADSCSGTSCM
jgi:hypothetical protein